MKIRLSYQENTDDRWRNIRVSENTNISRTSKSILIVCWEEGQESQLQDLLNN